MFTGIIETLGTIKSVETDGTNKIFKVESDLAPELSVDESLAHNGVCLTVTSIEGNVTSVTAVDETLKKTNLGKLNAGDLVNLERAMPANGRFDGHIVQGHVDQTGKCVRVQELDGSWIYDFEYDFEAEGHFLVEKGSVCINGTSLTVFNCEKGKFTVTIIPYTHENTNFKTLKAGDTINLEFDIIGKYIQRLVSQGYGEALLKGGVPFPKDDK
ncbi:riboflavin synthase subunit alpha [Fulvitalea axinellae]|uniref:Riboflavin synthase n=1 Tax=Fulvitalea axinellae TaxID=1182444 RepID=A0AAU9D081_9BACT|nr:riboflavin synthase subunit alpha [Fulvitalea axinellae]